MKTIALAGNPNSGKTTLFNALTGSRQRVGNWPGVTVEKKEGRIRRDPDTMLQDLPGIYSLSPYSLEEVVARNYLVKEHPDCILNIIDGTNLERNLYLTTQLLELGIPVVIAVNMLDLIRANGDMLDPEALSSRLGCPVVEISALKQEGIEKLIQEAHKAACREEQKALNLFSPEIQKALTAIETIISKEAKAPVEKRCQLWYSIKVFERDAYIIQELHLTDKQKEQIEKIIQSAEKQMDDDSESIITSQRYEAIAQILQGCWNKKARSNELTVSDKIDRIITNRIFAIPIFVLIMYLVYSLAMGSSAFAIGTMGTDWVNDVLFGEWIPQGAEALLMKFHVNEILSSLILDGIIAGVGAVLGFVPQMLILFLLLAFLEESGYMARVAFIMDRLFRRFGLSGKSFIPLLVATGCGVPGIMASRTIEQDRDRKMTIMTTGFIPCGAKMPIIGLFAGAVFGGSALVAVSAFLIGIAAVVISGIILKKFKIFAGEPAPFVIELPAYHWPQIKNVLLSAFERGWSFITRAGTLILASSIVLWFLQGFGFADGSFTMVEDNNYSLLADIGRSISWIFYPLGWTGEMAWKAAVASFTGLIAKEEVVSTFGVLYNIAGEVGEGGEKIWALIAADFSAVAAYSFMVFNLLCAPCFAAMGAIKREMNNTKWTLFAIGYMCLFAYVSAFMVYQIGSFFLYGSSFTIFTALAFLLLALLIYLLFRKGYTEDLAAGEHPIIALESVKQ